MGLEHLSGPSAARATHGPSPQARASRARPRSENGAKLSRLLLPPCIYPPIASAYTPAQLSCPSPPLPSAAVPGQAAARAVQFDDLAGGDMMVDVEEEEEYGGDDDDYPPQPPRVEVGSGQWVTSGGTPRRSPSAPPGSGPSPRGAPRSSWLVLRMDSDVDATLLERIASSCPSLQSVDISMGNRAGNWLTGDGLSRFVSDMQSMSVLKLDGCSSLGVLNVSSSRLSTLWLSGLRSLTQVVMNCPNLTELSLDFPEQNNDSTDLVALVDSLGRTCPNLRKLNISSIHLCNEVVFALESPNNLRGLCMLSLILGSKITDAAVASIVCSYPRLELLDLSGSGITDAGVLLISYVFPNTLTNLRLAMCPNITLLGVHVAVARLPLLRLMDCGMSIKICSKFSVKRKQDTTCLHKLIIKHNNLKKLSLWGCSRIDALYVRCPELVDLNLNLCTNLLPEGLLIQCPKLEKVHVKGCPDMLIGAVKNQVLNEFAAGAGSPRRRRAQLVN